MRRTHTTYEGLWVDGCVSGCDAEVMPSFGILHDLRRPSTDRRPYSTYYTECLDEIAHADRLGFDAVWMPEHHGTDDGMLPSPLVMAAAIAARTTRIRIGTSILVLPFHHPIRVAEDVAVADLLSGGRMVLGVGQGYAEQEFALFGKDRRQRGTLLEESVEVIRKAWTGERFSHHGTHWNFDDILVTPSPDRQIPVYVGGVTPKGLERAARIGDGLLVYCAKPADLIDRRKLYDGPLPFVCTTVLHVTDNSDQAWSEAAPGIAYLEGQLAAHDNRAAPDLHRDDYLVGTPDEIADRIRDLHAATGFAHLAHWARLPGLTHAQALHSLDLLSEVVAKVAP